MRVLIPWYKYPPSDPGRISGISVSFSEFALNLSKNGFVVDILTGEEQPSSPQNVPFQVLHSDMGRRILRGERLDQTDIQSIGKEYDYVFSIHNYGARSLSRLIGKSKLMRQIHAVFRVIPLRDSVLVKNSVLDYLRAYLRKSHYETEEQLLKGTLTVCVSKHLVEEMLAERLEFPHNLFQNPIGIDTSMFSPGATEKKFDMLFCGGFQRIKGIDILIDALCLLKTRSIKLAVVGRFDPSQRDYLMKKIPSSMKENVTFLGVLPHSDMPDIIRKSRFSVIPSRYESFSIFALESIACGVPVIASNVAALPELVGEENGIVFDPLSPQSLSNAIEHGLEDYDHIAAKAMKMGPLKARSYEWPIVIGQLKDILKEKLAQS